MGREQRRKQDKNYKHKIDENRNEVPFTFGTLIKIIVVCAVILLAFYFILAVFVTKEVNLSSNNKDSDNTNESTDSDTISNRILASKIFEQQEDSYYVYFYDFNNEDEKLQSSMSNLSDGTVYRVNTSDGLNSNYVTVEKSGNSKATSLNDLKVINPTLIKVNNDKITSYYEGVSSILDFINK